VARSGACVSCQSKQQRQPRRATAALRKHWSASVCTWIGIESAITRWSERVAQPADAPKRARQPHPDSAAEARPHSHSRVGAIAQQLQIESRPTPGVDLPGRGTCVHRFAHHSVPVWPQITC
jgi:hypothetical protein